MLSQSALLLDNTFTNFKVTILFGVSRITRLNKYYLIHNSYYYSKNFDYKLGKAFHQTSLHQYHVISTKKTLN